MPGEIEEMVAGTALFFQPPHRLENRANARDYIPATLLHLTRQVTLFAHMFGFTHCVPPRWEHNR